MLYVALYVAGFVVVVRGPVDFMRDPRISYVYPFPTATTHRPVLPTALTLRENESLHRVLPQLFLQHIRHRALLDEGMKKGSLA